MRLSSGLKGFTLVELLVVIAIIGILSSIVMVALGGAKQKARDGRRVADIKNIQLALSLYYNDNGMYPVNIYAAAGAAPAGGLAPAYLPTVPRDPNATGAEACSGTGGNALAGCYHYNTYGTNAGQICNTTTNLPLLYHIGAAMEDTTNPALSQDVNQAVSGQTLSYLGTTYYRCDSPSPAPTVHFHGDAAACNGTTAASPDPCYDLTP